MVNMITKCKKHLLHKLNT